MTLTSEVIKKFLAGQSVASLAREFGVAESAIHRWKKDALTKHELSGQNADEMLALRTRARELEMRNQSLKKTARNLKAGEVSPVSLHRNRTGELSRAPVVSRVTQVPASGYYAWQARLEKPPAPARVAESERVKACFTEHRRRYGSRRVAVSTGLGSHRVSGIMRREGLRAIAPKRFTPRTADSRRDARVSPTCWRASA